MDTLRVRHRASSSRFDPSSAAPVSWIERVGDLFRMPVARAWMRWRRSMGLPIAVASSSNLQLNHSIGLGIRSAPVVRPASNGEPREQAHLPAEQPSPRQDTRLPPAHAHARRPRHHHRPSSQGPLRALGLRTDVLPARHRLRDRADFTSAVRGPGASRAGGPLLVVHANRTDARAELPPRVGFVVSKAVGNAVTRNLTKRRLRGIMATKLSGIPHGVDVVVRANPAAARATYRNLADSLALQVDRVCRSLSKASP